MTPFIQGVTNLFSGGIVVIQIAIVLVLASLLAKPTGKKKNGEPQGFAKLGYIVGKYWLELGFLMSFGSVIVSHFYSTIAHFEPCEFCWWARILIFPQAVLFGVALYYKNKKQNHDALVMTTSLIMSVIGGLLMAFQYYSQMFDPSLLDACVANGASCTKLYFVSFGYITIPMMALTGFIFMILVVLARKRYLKA
jgi:disulfide bond formation protein DsbB